MIRVADYIVDKIYNEGAKDIFMVTGRGILFLSDAVAKHVKMQAVSVHHEQAGAYAAMAYAQSNNNIGACLVSTGCAACNAITGVLCAYQDSVPCIFISGQNMLSETTYYTQKSIRTYGSQEANIVALVKPITKYAVMLTDPSRVVYELEKALYIMRAGRPGPVWIDVPLDIQNARIEVDKLQHYSRQGAIKLPSDIHYREAVPRDEDIRYIFHELYQAERPVFLLGNGVKASGATENVRRLIQKIKIPVVYSPAAADVYGSANQYSIGSVGSIGGTREGNFAVQNADLIISIGCGLSSVITGNLFEKFGREAKLIVIDIDKEQHTKNELKIDRLILADALKVIEALNQTDFYKKYNEWVEKCLHWKQIFPLGLKRDGDVPDLYYLAEILNRHMPENAAVVCDAGYEELIIPSSVHYNLTQKCIHPCAQGAMGYALPAAMGIWMDTKAPVIAIIGDGSIMMNLQELQTIVSYHMPIKILVINNNAYAVIRKRQQDLFRTRTIGTDCTNGVTVPDFERVANCFNVRYEHISTIDELNSKLTDILFSDESILCEINCVTDQRYLHMSVARGINNKIVHRPLEDLSPFLDRETFLNEMIVKPIDQ